MIQIEARRRRPLLVVLLLISFASAGVVSAAVPDQINFQGLLLDAAGQPLTGPVDLRFSLFSTLSGGTAAWTELHTSVDVQDGIYDVPLGAIVPLDGVLDSVASLFLEVSVDGEVLTPRQQFLSVPYALRARSAEFVGGLPSGFASLIFEQFEFDGGVPANDDPSEGVGDTDGDGLANFIDPDNDDDGIPDVAEVAAGTDINLTTPAVVGFVPAEIDVIDISDTFLLTVLGTNFEPGMFVTVGTQSVTPVSVTSTSFDVMLNVEPEGLASVAVTIGNGEIGTAAVEFVYPTPQITGFWPTTALVDTTTTVSVQGNNFLPGLVVNFGSETPSVINLTPSSFDVQVGPQGVSPVIVNVDVTLLNGKAASSTFQFRIAQGIVFVTSVAQNGNLGGIGGADTICATAATNAGLSGSFIAYLDTDTTDLVTRLGNGVGSYVGTNGFAGPPWNRDEFGVLGGSSVVWTGLKSGGAAGGPNCDNWTSNSSGLSGRVGKTTRGDSGWVDDSTRACNLPSRLYCFQN